MKTVLCPAQRAICSASAVYAGLPTGRKGMTPESSAVPALKKNGLLSKTNYLSESCGSLLLRADGSVSELSGFWRRWW